MGRSLRGQFWQRFSTMGTKAETTRQRIAAIRTETGRGTGALTRVGVGFRIHIGKMLIKMKQRRLGRNTPHRHACDTRQRGKPLPTSTVRSG